jgi:hypothetical protein
MDDDIDELKCKIIKIIEKIDRIDILEYIYHFISVKFKAGK